MKDHTLILMRHARQDIVGGRDHERPLTPEGRDDAQRVGQRLRSEGPLPARALVSTARRCRETWETIQATLASPIEVEFESSLYNASARELLDAIAGVEETIPSLLVLAHNPGISVLALELAMGGDHEDLVRGGFTPASMCCFEIEGPWSAVSPRSASLTRFDRI